MVLKTASSFSNSMIMGCLRKNVAYSNPLVVRGWNSKWYLGFVGMKVLLDLKEGHSSRGKRDVSRNSCTVRPFLILDCMFVSEHMYAQNIMKSWRIIEGLGDLINISK